MYLVGPILVRMAAGLTTPKEPLMSVPPWPTESHEPDIVEDGAPADRVASLRARHRASRSYTVGALILIAGSVVLALAL